MFKNKVLLITGGTGSFGNAVLKRFLNSDLKEIRIFSRDEKKQDDMRKKYSNDKLKFYIGDVRDAHSVQEAMKGVDYVFHAAALKQVPSCEFFPLQAVQTNVIGTGNVLDAAIENNVKKVIVLSTDKAAYPINAMGMSKALMEKVAVAKGRNVGENNSKYNKVDYTCDFCGKSIKVPLYRYKEKRKDGSPSNHFCSKECSNKYRSVNYSGENHPMYGVKFGNERIQSMRKIGAESVQKISRTLTKPHRTINKLLDDNNISYINEKVLDFYSIDICLSDNLMIEIMGDYWHSNPLASCNKDKELKYAQKVNLPKDKAKHTYIKKYYNFELLYLWESNIEKDETLCLKLIQKYINNNGILQDYNSFNYYVNDKNELCLKDNITKPYFMI